MKRKRNPSQSIKEAVSLIRRYRQPGYTDTQATMVLAETGLFPKSVSGSIADRLASLVIREMDGMKIDHNEVRIHRSFLMGFLRCKLSDEDYEAIEDALT